MGSLKPQHGYKAFWRLNQQSIYDVKKYYLHFFNVINHNDTYFKTHDLLQQVAMRHKWKKKQKNIIFSRTNEAKYMYCNAQKKNIITLRYKHRWNIEKITTTISKSKNYHVKLASTALRYMKKTCRYAMLR